MSIRSANAQTIEQELEWFQELILLRGKITFEQSVSEEAIQNLKLQSIEDQDSIYVNLIKNMRWALKNDGFDLALIPHMKPSMLDLLNMKIVEI